MYAIESTAYKYVGDAVRKRAELPLLGTGKQAYFTVAVAKGHGVLEHLSSKGGQSYIFHEPACSKQQNPVGITQL